MDRRTRTLAVIGLGVAGAMVLTGCRTATPPRDAARPAGFTVNEIASQPGAAFTVAGELGGGLSSQEIVTSSFNFTPPVGGPPSPLPGSVTVYSKSGSTWTPTTIVPTTEGIVGPNRPTITDVDGDFDNDIILPAGYFFDRSSGLNKGSLTWWENTGSAGFVRHNIVTGVNGAYHGVNFVDFDKDGKKDIVTTYEDGGWPAWPFGAAPPFVPASAVVPIARVEVFKGLGGGAFDAPVKIADGGGSLPVTFDIDQDGDLDVATAQYFKVKAAPIFPFGITDESFVWFENKSVKGTPFTAADFSKHVIASGLGESFQIMAVDNMDGDGRYSAVGVNHVNPALPGGATPKVVRLTPGADVTQPWTVSTIADGFTVDDTRNGQAAPGNSSEGDLDGDGDIDLATAGDSDFGIYWIERKGDGSWVKHDVAAEYGVAGTNYGQGSVFIADLNNDGKNELVFSSYNAGKVVVMERTAKTGGIVPAVPHVPDALMPY